MKSPPLLRQLLVALSTLLLAISSTTFAQDTETSGDGSEAAETVTTWVDTYDALLQKYVSQTGVAYNAWHKSREDVAALAEVAEGISSQDLSRLSNDGKLAFYLNAYNAWILRLILQDYPTDGPGGGGFFGRNRFFKSNSIRVAGKEMSFDALEHEIIRPKFKDPRIHFALNCASHSCPPLHQRAFREETLSTTLDQLTRTFVNTIPQGVKTSEDGRKVTVSKIFDWYEDDFTGGILSYINRYRKTKIPEDAKLTYQKYSWKLNATR